MIVELEAIFVLVYHLQALDISSKLRMTMLRFVVGLVSLRAGQQ
jgi:hypothetical protein